MSYVPVNGGITLTAHAIAVLVKKISLAFPRIMSIVARIFID